jgi:hypothetical protein
MVTDYLWMPTAYTPTNALAGYYQETGNGTGGNQTASCTYPSTGIDYKIYQTQWITGQQASVSWITTGTTGSNSVSSDTSWIIHRREQQQPILTDAEVQALWGNWSAAVHIKRTEEQQREEERLRLIAVERQKRRSVADARGEALLKMFLNRQQKEHYEENRYFEVLSHDGKRRYRLHRGWAGNVQVFEGDRHVETLCIHPAISVPLGDHLLSQKLMIETDEANFRKVANITHHLPRRVA